MKKQSPLFLLLLLLNVLCYSCSNEPAKSSQKKVVATEPNTDTDSIDNFKAIINDLEKDSTIGKYKPTPFVEKDGFQVINWMTLSYVDYDEQFIDSLDAYIPYPLFHPSIKALDGKKIQIKGHVIPVEETKDESIVILSANPFANCFFCGGAGPESVMDIQLKKRGVRLTADDRVSFRGRLRLNSSDLDYLNYILDDAEVVE